MSMIQECDCGYYTLLNLPAPGGGSGTTGPTGPIGPTGPNPLCIDSTWLGNINSLITDGQVFLDTNDSTTTTQITISSISFPGIDYTTFFTDLLVLPSRTFRMAEGASNALWRVTSITQVGATKFVFDVTLLSSTGVITNSNTLKTNTICFGGEQGPTGPRGPTGPTGPAGIVLGASVYGEMKTSTTVTTKTFAALNVFEGFFSLTPGVTSGVTINVGTPVIVATFTVLTTGVYNIQGDFSFNRIAGGGNTVYQVAPFINGVQAGVGQIFDVSGPDTVAVTITALANLVAGQVIDVKIAQLSGAVPTTLDILRTNELIILTSPVQGPTGPLGPTGPSGTLLANGAAYSDYLYWEPTTTTWTPGTNNTEFHLGYNAGAGFKPPAGGTWNTFVGAEAGVVGPGTPGRFDITAVGYQAVNSLNFNGGNNTAVGSHALETLPLADAVAVGSYAGRLNAGIGSVSIGTFLGAAGQQNLGNYSITIGRRTGESNFPARCIILNASGTPTTGVAAQTDSFYVRPIRSAAGTQVLNYNPTTFEITQTSQGTIASNFNSTMNYNVGTTFGMNDTIEYYFLIRTNQAATVVSNLSFLVYFLSTGVSLSVGMFTRDTNVASGGLGGSFSLVGAVTTLTAGTVGSQAGNRQFTFAAPVTLPAVTNQVAYYIGMKWISAGGATIQLQGSNAFVANSQVALIATGKIAANPIATGTTPTGPSNTIAQVQVW